MICFGGIRMQLVPYIAAYIGLAVFLIAVLARIQMWRKMPIHVRWELYPVAHEPGRAHYGGSYLEEGEWWRKGREVSLWGEIRAMVPEILFLVALKEHNPALWRRSFPFHFGLYLIVGCTVVMMGQGLLSLVAPSLLGGPLAIIVLNYLVIGLGAAGLALSLFGAIGLLRRRLGDPDLVDFTTKADVFNLVFFLIAFGSAFVTFLAVDRDFTRVSSFVANLVTLNLVALPGRGAETILPMVTAVLMSAMVAYIPLTHMSHFIGKYFAYHAIRWNDTPNLPGGKQEKKIADVLGQKVTWAAPHIDGKGEKSWANLATEEFKK
jgi:nitrate reductase gamma subunit